jgi:gamma-glutamyltranspeptidase/glutathione hydrolase
MRETSAQAPGWQAASQTGVVVAGGADAVAAGIGILARGGNAADAAAATILALNVTDHGACSIGGEAPVILYDAGQREVKVLCGQGRAPLSPAAVEWYMEHGIPARGDIKIAPVPAVVDLCVILLQRYGTAPFAEVVAPALALLDAGQASWQPRLAVTLRKLVEAEQGTPGSCAAKLQAASDRFYGRNAQRHECAASPWERAASPWECAASPWECAASPWDIADDLEAFYVARGGFLRRADLAAHVTPVEDPVTVEYRGYTVCKCGPWTQGPYLCQALRLLEGYDLQAMGHLSADYVHVVVEAIKLAIADRDEYYGDPAFVDVPLAALLSEAYAELRRPLIDMQRASLEARPGDPYAMQPLKGPGVVRPGVGGTTTCLVADRWGNVVAATPSANVEDFDGGPAGVTYSNRLVSFNTTPGHPNCIQPGKRPRITLTPTLVLKNGRPVLAISVAGGDLQDQVSLNLLLDFVEFGMPPAEAVTAVRFATGHHQDSFNPNRDRAQTFGLAGSLTVGAGLSREVSQELARRGHRLQATASPIGAPAMLSIDPHRGTLYAAGDPAAGRHAAGLDEEGRPTLC